MNKIRCGACMGKGYTKGPANKVRGVTGMCLRCNGAGEREVIGDYGPGSPHSIESINYELLHKLRLNKESPFFRELRIKEDVRIDELIEWAKSPDLPIINWLPPKPKQKKLSTLIRGLLP